MINNYMQEYISNWSYKRIIQLGVGAYFLWEYYQHPSTFAMIIGVMMSFQAIFNVGCFSTRGCNTNIDESQKENFSEDDNIDFEEVE